MDEDYYAHHCRHCGDRLDEDHSCAATDYGVAGQRVKMIFPEFKKSERTHIGKTGVLIAHNPSTGRSEVIFDNDETVEIDACCLQELAN